MNYFFILIGSVIAVIGLAVYLQGILWRIQARNGEQDIKLFGKWILLSKSEVEQKNNAINDLWRTFCKGLVQRQGKA